MERQCHGDKPWHWIGYSPRDRVVKDAEEEIWYHSPHDTRSHGIVGSNRVHIVQVLNGMEKHAAAHMVRKMILHFCLEVEVQEVGLGEMKYILRVCPLGSQDWDNRVKPGNG